MPELTDNESDTPMFRTAPALLAWIIRASATTIAAGCGLRLALRRAPRLALRQVLFAALFACVGINLLACIQLPIPPGNHSGLAGDGHAISFAFGGDIAGQNVCRDLQLGFPILEHVIASRPDFFIGLGDMIYADSPCETTGLYGNPQIARPSGNATNLDSYRANWQYVRDDPTLARLLASVPYFAVWDDHEVRNDFGPGNDHAPNNENLQLLPAGRAAFLEFNPGLPALPYYKRQFGPLLDVFFLDTRSFRDLNSAVDDPFSPKTMLGSAQREWLIASLGNSKAVWKVIISSVPLSIPTGWPAENGRDGWANYDQDTGFELELLAMLREMAELNLENILFLSADVHFATAFRYQPFSEYPAFSFHEIVTGPLHAGLFPNYAVDDSLRPERLFMFGPETPASVSDFEAALGWFNFGFIHIDAGSVLNFSLIDGYGRTREQLELVPGEHSKATR